MEFIFIILSWMILLVPGFDDSVPPTGDKIFKIETSPDIVQSITIQSEEYFDFSGFDIQLKQNSTGTLDLKIPKNLPHPASNIGFWAYDERPIVLTDGSEIGYDVVEDPCYSHYRIPIDGKTNLELLYTVILTGSWKLYSPIQFDEDNPCYNIVFSKKLDSPLKQINLGIPLNKIQCKESLILIQKYDGSPACVTESTKQKLVERGWTAKNDLVSKTNTNCMSLEQSKQIASFFKTPTYLPEGYYYVCSRSGTPFESYIVYYNQEFPTNWQILELVNKGAIFIYQIDERNLVGEKEFQTYGSAEQRIQETYDDVMKNNPSLNPQLITINGMLAYAVDSCSDCGKQTANFTDGTIQKSASTETKIKFIDENGIKYFLKGGIPLNELIKVAESLQ